MLKLATPPLRGVIREGGYDWDAIMSSSHAKRALGTIRAELDGAPNSQVPLGRAEAAKTVEALDRRLLANPQDVLAMAGRGFYLTYIGRHKEAILELDRAIALDPRCRMAHAYRGAALLELGLYGDALEAFELARSCSPEPVDHFNIGITLRLLDRKLEASRAIKMAGRLIQKRSGGTFSTAMPAARWPSTPSDPKFITCPHLARRNRDRQARRALPRPASRCLPCARQAPPGRAALDYGHVAGPGIHGKRHVAFGNPAQRL